MEYKEKILLFIKFLSEVPGKNKYQINAYENAINTIKGLPDNITVNDFINNVYKGIGDRIRQRILFYSGLNPYVEESDITAKNRVINEYDKEKILKNFLIIEDVGIKKANKLYDIGYRNIEDIQESDVTRNQWIGIQYYYDLIQRIPRYEIQKFEYYLKKYLNKINPKDPILFKICGSYRRKKSDSGDIDILVLSKKDKNRNVMNEILTFPGFVITLAKGEKKYRGIGGVSGIFRRIDIEICQPIEMPYALLYFTGSKEFNEKCRELAKRQDMRLNEKYMIIKYQKPGLNLLPVIFKRKNLPDITYYKIICNSEKQILDILGMNYIEPQYR